MAEIPTAPSKPSTTTYFLCLLKVLGIIFVLLFVGELLVRIVVPQPTLKLSREMYVSVAGVGVRHAPNVNLIADAVGVRIGQQPPSENPDYRILNVVNTTPVLREAYHNGTTKLFDPLDRHFTPEAHAIVAEVLLPTVRAELAGLTDYQSSSPFSQPGVWKAGLG